MSPPTFPQELIDKIIDQFGGTPRSDNDHVPNKSVLATLSMVAKAWKERSQKHLFSVIEFRGYPTPIVESDFNELNLVFSLTKDLEIDGNWEIYSQFDGLAMASLRCFRNLESLTLAGWYFRWHNARQLKNCFSHLGETLIHLKVEGTASSEALIHLTSMLPRLIIIELSITTVPGEGGPISREELPTTGSFQGYLHLWGLSEVHNDFLSFVSSTSPRFDSICIDDCDTGGGTAKLVKSSAASLESLELYIDSGDIGDNLTSLSECTQLREVSISYPYPESTASLLQTIRSPHFKKFMVQFNLWPHGTQFGDGDSDAWRNTDNELCMAYGLWTKHVGGPIDVTFRLPRVDRIDYSLEEYQRDLKKLFPRLIENVPVNIVC